MTRPLSLYSHCAAYGFLPRKELYTKRDVDAAIVDSLFKPGGTLSEREARWLVKCSAIHHETEYSKWVEEYNTPKRQAARMFA